MNWEHLKTFDCPYCGSKLKKEETLIVCTTCAFEIAPARYKSIVRTRTGERRDPMKWQFLKNAQCPKCESFLTKNLEGRLAYQKCMNAHCTFKIRDDRLEEILADENHPANLYETQHRDTHNLQSQT